jgi:DNA-binding MarR family transcriptional regulator
MMEDSYGTLSGLDDHLGYWLRHVSNHVCGSFARSLEGRQFTVAEWVALRQLYDHSGITSADLSELLGVTRGAVSKILDKLDTKDMVERVVRQDDKRSHTLSLTPKGQRILPELAEIADDNDQQFFNCLSADERTTLKTLLQNVARFHQWGDVPID